MKIVTTLLLFIFQLSSFAQMISTNPEEIGVGPISFNSSVIKKNKIKKIDVVIVDLIVFKNEKETVKFQFKINHLDPIDEVSGIKARLKNLGYFDGDINNNMDEELSQALRDFQEANNLIIDGKISEMVKAKIKQIHGS